MTSAASEGPALSTSAMHSLKGAIFTIEPRRASTMKSIWTVRSSFT